MTRNDDTQPIEIVTARLRANPLDFAGDLGDLRQRFETLGRSRGDAAAIDGAVIGGVPVLDLPGRDRAGVVLFVHAGGYVAGSAASSLGLALDLSQATGRRVVSVDYRLAPEHPFPAARDDVIAAYQGLLAAGVDAGEIAFVGASAGGGLVIQALQWLRDAGIAQPAAAALISPFSDLSLDGASYAFNAERDPSLTRRGLEAAARHYRATDAAVAPTSESLRGLPPLHIQVGSIEVLLSDATDLAAKAAAVDVRTTLVVWPGMVHVFPTFAAILPEGMEALRLIGTELDRELGEPQAAQRSVG